MLFTAATLAVAGAAVVSGNNLLFLIVAAMMATLLVSGLVSRLCLAALELDFLVPEHVAEVRVVDIVGLDKQADGGTHVRSTAEVGRIRVLKTESKGKGNKRIRIEVLDA